MAEDQIIKDSFDLLQKDFSIQKQPDIFSEEELVKALTPLIRHLLDKDFERLLLICYRIDLKENILKEILHSAAPENIASDLSKAIVQRQIQKIKIRQMYSGS